MPHDCAVRTAAAAAAALGISPEREAACPNCGAARVCAARAGHKAPLRYQQALAEAERARLQAAPWTQGPLLAARRNRRGLVRRRPSSAYCLRHATPATCSNVVPTGKFHLASHVRSAIFRFATLGSWVVEGLGFLSSHFAAHSLCVTVPFSFI